MLRQALVAFALSAGCSIAFVATAEPDWASIQGKEIPMFYPGPAAYEWVMDRTEHTGAFKLGEKKQNCFDCHEYDADVIGQDVVSGKKVGKARKVIDQNVPSGRRGTFPLRVKAAHDNQKLYLRFEWESPAKPDGGPLLDPKNEIKLSVMFDNGHNDDARMSGCWMTCHMDLRTMPDAADKAKRHARAKTLGWNDGVTKYLPDSRTALSIDNKPRGGWNKLRSDGEIKLALKEGKFLDLIQYRSGAGEKPVDGYVLESRHMDGGKSLLKATGTHEENRWAVTFERLLAGNGVGDHTLKAGQQFTFGVSIHENHGNARFHHVSLGYTLGLDDGGAFVNVARLPATTLSETPASGNNVTPGKL